MVAGRYPLEKPLEFVFVWRAVPEPESQVNFVGSIGSLSPFNVGGRAVTTDESIRILDRKNNPIPFSSLKVGDKLEVEGTSRSDGSVLAKKLKLQD